MTTWLTALSILRLPQRPKQRLLVASLATASLIAVLVLAPFAAGVEATSALLPSREAGQPGFVASHRGDKAGAPENTLPALQRAIDSDAQFVETDVQLTSDGVPVLMHDWTVDRTTNGTGPVWAYSYEKLASLDAGSWYDPEFADTRVPTLEEFLTIFAASSKRAIIELKGSWTAEQSRTVALQVSAAGVEDRVLLASFDIMTLRGLQQVAPKLPRAIITRTVAGDPAVLAEACGAVAIITSHAFVSESPEIVGQIHAAGLAVMLYTLNNAESWAAATALGVDGIITDKPDQLGKWLNTESSGQVAVETSSG